MCRETEFPATWQVELIVLICPYWDSHSSSDHNVEILFSFFKESLRPWQITLVWKLSGSDFESAFESLSSGPTLDSLVQAQNTQYIGKQLIKVYAGMDDKWAQCIKQLVLISVS